MQEQAEQQPLEVILKKLIKKEDSQKTQEE